MLFNPKWSETKADPFSLASLISWLEKQPADREYDFFDAHGCLLAQFAKTHDPRASLLRGRKTGKCQFEGTYHINGCDVDMLPFMDVAIFSPFTFGAALDRARKLAGVS